MARVYSMQDLDSPPAIIEYGYSYGGGVKFSPDNRCFF